jgi:hypothetical protein
MIHNTQLASVRDCTRVLPPKQDGREHKPAKDEKDLGRKMRKLARDEHRARTKTDAPRKGHSRAETAARRQAKEIKAFWAERGFKVKAKAEYSHLDDAGYQVWRVITNLKNGMPQ